MRFAHASQVRGSCEAGTMSNGVAPCSQRVEGRGERVEGRGTTTGLCLLKRCRPRYARLPTNPLPNSRRGHEPWLRLPER